MIFSHISDTHLGLVQYGSEERAQDVYDAFNQAIDISIKDKVDFVIFAGDITKSKWNCNYSDGKWIKTIKTKQH